MSGDPIIASTPEAFGDVYADGAKKRLYCFAECPPVGKMRLDIKSDAFGFEIEESETPDGPLVLNLKNVFFTSKAEETAGLLHKLSRPWQTLWPRIYNSLLQVRQEYRCSAAVTTTNCSLVFAPPEAEDEYWWCELELYQWDGFYVVKFTLAGEIAEAFASF